MCNTGIPTPHRVARALRYYATGRIEFRRGQKITQKKQVVRNGKPVTTEVAVGRWTQISVEKDKSTRPNREGSFVFDFDLKTIDHEWELISLGLEDGLIERSDNGKYEYTDLDGRDLESNREKIPREPS